MLFSYSQRLKWKDFLENGKRRCACQKGEWWMSCFFAGNATRLCDANGRWTGSEPKCQPIACGDPVTFPHTTVALINGSTSWKARAQYSCIFGYQPLNTNGNLTNLPKKTQTFSLSRLCWTKIFLDFLNALHSVWKSPKMSHFDFPPILV